MDKHKAQDYIEQNLTEKDVEKWHKGTCSRHVSRLMKEAGVDEIQIYGSFDGPEPVSVVVH